MATKKAAKKAAKKKGVDNFLAEMNATAMAFAGATKKKIVCKVWPDTGKFECRKELQG